MKYPYVSIIIPAYNASSTIGPCIESLIQSDYPDDRFEVIVIDNNSTDDTRIIAESYGVLVLVQSQIQSSYASRNTGVTQSKGELVGFTDSDCIVSRSWISNAVRYFQEDTGIGCLAGKIVGEDPSNIIEKYLIDKDALSHDISFSHPFLPYSQTANTFYRRQVFNQIGLFEERWISGGDVDRSWSMQLNTDYKIALADDVVIKHVHRSSLKGFLKQRKTWGIGEVNLYKKYRYQLKTLPSYSFKTSLSGYRLMAKYLLKYAIIRIQYVFSHGSSESLAYKQLDFLASYGRRVGRIKGSLLNRVILL